MTVGEFKRVVPDGVLIEKNPTSTLDYVIDLSLEMAASGDTLATVTWDVPAGLTSVLTSKTDTQAVIWLTGGTYSSSVTTQYVVTCTYTTTAGRGDSRQFTVLMRPVYEF
ncbi:phage fiber-tail adaptor protein [Candidatus Contendibacter odensensis]|uniref:Uncharacterized protein n=1 Tax=Candidatus Contendobacter odensis Run_B_J11 TaxID=1400861 RepID=A0A7U7GEM7_9GAMM|nr:hypothetical protein [Candidatus Contendobacter odensis]CDH46961.1 hypothetical protein BN874_690011 [Candidatus Contendobacter odensis Run_B_J11]